MSKQLVSIHVDESDLGIKWTLNIMGRIVNSGYARDQWAALDAANEELAAQFFSPLGRYYQAQKKGTE
jgi:hypothetical protein